MKKTYLIICSSFALTTNAQIINTVCGTGTGTYTGDGGQATSAELYYPRGVDFDAVGNLYVADMSNQRIRKITTSGIISTIAGNGTAGYSGDGGQATAAALYSPYGVAFDAIGNLYIVDASNSCIRRVNTSGIISTFVGNGTNGYSGDGGQATAAALYNPAGLVIDATGNMYIADAASNRIRKVNTAGIITTFAGNGTGGYSGDGGQATAAELYNPYDVAVDAIGNLYIVDASNSRIRKVNTSGIISTVAGNGTAGYSGDGGQATATALNYPTGLTVDATGNLYIADDANNRIRKVTNAGIINTITGNGTLGFSGDGAAASAAELNDPIRVAVDAAGNMYIADAGNNRIRMVCFNGCAVTAGIQTHNQAGVNIFSYGNAIITNGAIAQGTQLRVYNTLGQVVLTTALQNNIETNLPSGIYTIQVIDNTGSIIEIKKCALINN